MVREIQQYIYNISVIPRIYPSEGYSWLCQKPIPRAINKGGGVYSTGCQKIFTASVHGLQYFTASFSPWRVRGVFAFFFIKRGRKPFKGASTLIYKNMKRGHTMISSRHIKEAMIIHRESNIRPLFNHDAFEAFSRYFSLKEAVKSVNHSAR